MNKSELLEVILNVLPYPEQIKELDFDLEETAIRFTWRGDRFRVTTDGDVCQVLNDCAHWTNITIVLRALIQREIARRFIYG